MVLKYHETLTTIAYMPTITVMANIQYTIRGIPPKIDIRLRKLARLRGQSLNQVVIEQLSAQDNIAYGQRPRPAQKAYNTDFDEFFGTMTPLDGEVESALRAQRAVDTRDW